MWIRLAQDDGHGGLITTAVNTDDLSSLSILDWGRQPPHRARVNLVWRDGRVDRDLVVPDATDEPTSKSAARSVAELLMTLQEIDRPPGIPYPTRSTTP